MKDIYLIILDTLRLDYSNKFFEYLVKEFGFISLDRAVAPAPWTVPSHASIFTGVYPLFHKCHETKKIKIPEIRLKYSPLLSHKLRGLGFETYLLSANTFITPSFGFTGFSNMYFYIPYSPLSLKNRCPFIPNILKKPVQKALNFLKLIRAYACDNWPIDKGISKISEYFSQVLLTSSTRKFVFINLMEVHEPYYLFDDLSVLEKIVLGEPIDRSVYNKWKTGYKRESRYLSKNLRNILEMIPEDSLVIITSDHGQLLGEHGLLGHGNFLHDELIRVPLYIRFPSILNVDHYPKEEDKWISLTSLHRLILNYVKTSALDLSLLYSKFVISETYGIAGKIHNLRTDNSKNRVKTLEQHRIAFFYKSYKIIFNVDLNKIEEIYDVSKNKRIGIDSFEESSNVLSYVKSLISLAHPRIRAKSY